MAVPRGAGDSGKALLLRVGIDRGAGGALAPIFQDGRFEYVPIPETSATRSPLTYATLPGRRVSSLATVLPPRLALRRPHLDPDFAAAAYGDAALGKRRQLLRLSRGDVIVFYAGLAPRPPEDRPRLFAIGTLRVSRVHDLRDGEPMGADLGARLAGTAHFLRQPRDPELALVEGESGGATLFERATPLGDGRDRMLPDLARLGYKGSLLRSVGHWICGHERLRLLQAWLANGPASLVDGNSRLLPLETPVPALTPEGALALELRGARDGDWFVSLAKRGRLQAFGRISCDQGDERLATARSSLFWRFLDEGLAMPRPLVSSAWRAAGLQRLVSWIQERYRIGVHQSAIRNIGRHA